MIGCREAFISSLIISMQLRSLVPYGDNMIDFFKYYVHDSCTFLKYRIEVYERYFTFEWMQETMTSMVVPQYEAYG